MADQLGRAEDLRTRADRILRRERWRVDDVTFTRQGGSVKLVDNTVNAEVIGAVGVDGRFEGPVINGKLVGADGTLAPYQTKKVVAKDQSSGGAGRGSVSEGHGETQPEVTETGASWVAPGPGMAIDDPQLAMQKGLDRSRDSAGRGSVAGSTEATPSAAARNLQEQRRGTGIPGRNT